MPHTYPKRLIEVDLPIARISAHARREKSIRHGHISTLHIWWARRPLAACRAVICAALWPDPADPLCPPAFREAAIEALTAFAKRVNPGVINEEGFELRKTLSEESRGRWEALAAGTLTFDAEQAADMPILRLALLDFIADFANWDNSTVPAYLETSRTLTQAAHEALGGVPGTRPLVVDPFAGGGSIPLEALRVGADAFASDLNPVAVLLNKVVLEYIPKYGNAEIKMRDADGKEITFRGLAEAVRYWGNWVKEQVEQELAEFYPKGPDGGTPIAYLWARTILSEAPGQGDIPVEVPLIRSLWLCKKPKRKVALRWVREKSGAVHTETCDVSYADGATRTVRRPLLEIFEPKRDSEVEGGTVARGSATCPVTGYTTPVKRVRDQLIARNGGAGDSRMLAVISTSEEAVGRLYRLPNTTDTAAEHGARSRMADEVMRGDGIHPIPQETLPLMSGVFNVPIYGHTTWGSLFTPRQSLVLNGLSRQISSIPNASDAELNKSLRTLLAIVFDRQVDKLTALCRWDNTRENAQGTFGRQALGMLWDYNEVNPFSGAGGDWSTAVGWVALLLERESTALIESGHVEWASATSHPLPNESCVSFITDPPYYNAVPYADLSDFFYVWLRRNLLDIHPTLFGQELSPKDDEACEMAGWDPKRYSHKNGAWYEAQMTKAMAEARRCLSPFGVGVVVFAHKTTGGWEAQLNAMIEAGLVITGSWPVDTEMENRLRAMGSAALSSSVHLVCRPREDADGNVTESVGEWRDVLSELPRRIHEWMPRLAAEGVVGADAIFACLGPALEVFSRYSRVEKADGEAVPLRDYLEQVWAAVSTEALSLIFKDADASGLEPDARLTAMWLWTLGGGGTNGNGAKEDTAENGESAEQTEDEVEDAEESSPRFAAVKAGFTLEFDAARKIAQGLGVHLEKSETLVEVKGEKARLLPVAERAEYLFTRGTSAVQEGKKRKGKKPPAFEFMREAEAEAEAEARTGIGDLKPGATVLDRVHQAMLLFAAGRGEALKRFLLEDAHGRDPRFWRLAQSLAALYPRGTQERRWVEGVLARKKGLGL